MREKEKTTLVAITILVMLITIVNIPKLFLNKKEELPEVKLREINKNKTFAIMVSNDTRDEYTTYSGNKWPTDEEDYYYNHAECVDNKGNIIENAITYNEENNTASLTINSTIYCTLYFDKYNYMKVLTHDVPYNNYTILAPIYMSSKIKNVEFVDRLPNLKQLKENETYWDISDTSQGTPAGSVIAWLEPVQNDESFKTLYIGSKTKIRAISLAYLFEASEFGDDLYGTMNIESINFNDKIDTSKTTDLYGIFNNQTKLSSIKGLENWDTSNVTNARALFYKCKNLSDINFLSNWNVSNIENMHDLFGFCSRITNIDALSSWNTQNVTSMRGMLRNLSELEDISPLNKWNLSNNKDLSAIFAGCTNLQTINLSSWDTSKVENMSEMFSNCTNLKTIDMQNATFTQITESANYANMFNGVPSSAIITVKNDVQKTWIQQAGFNGTIKLPNEL